jgi:hypothetical protein
MKAKNTQITHTMGARELPFCTQSGIASNDHIAGVGNMIEVCFDNKRKAAPTFDATFNIWSCRHPNGIDPLARTLAYSEVGLAP